MSVCGENATAVEFCTCRDIASAAKPPPDEPTKITFDAPTALAVVRTTFAAARGTSIIGGPTYQPSARFVASRSVGSANHITEPWLKPVRVCIHSNRG